MNDRAFHIEVVMKGLIFKKVRHIVISDGYNEVKLLPHELFVIDTDKSIIEPILKKG